MSTYIKPGTVFDIEGTLVSVIGVTSKFPLAKYTSKEFSSNNFTFTDDVTFEDKAGRLFSLAVPVFRRHAKASDVPFHFTGGLPDLEIDGTLVTFKRKTGGSRLVRYRYGKRYKYGKNVPILITKQLNSTTFGDGFDNTYDAETALVIAVLNRQLVLDNKRPPYHLLTSLDELN